jgi:hypothetical protein
MTDKPTTAAGYPPHFTDLVHATCLYVATRLGDLLDDVVVIGGLVPSLLISPASLPEDADAHVGTMDLDLGLTLALLDEERYKTLTERLRSAGFEPDVNESKQRTRQRWKIKSGEEAVTVDFLIPPSTPDDKGGRLRNIEEDFAAIIAPGLELAFRNRVRVPLKGATIVGELAEREIWVCGPAAYVVLKALAFELRGENKDAYDLYYVIRYHEDGLDALARDLRELMDDPNTRKAQGILTRDFGDHDGLGPQRVAKFLSGGVHPDIQADVVGFVTALCGKLEEGNS